MTKTNERGERDELTRMTTKHKLYDFLFKRNIPIISSVTIAIKRTWDFFFKNNIVIILSVSALLIACIFCIKSYVVGDQIYYGKTIVYSVDGKVIVSSDPDLPDSQFIRKPYSYQQASHEWGYFFTDGSILGVTTDYGWGGLETGGNFTVLPYGWILFLIGSPFLNWVWLWLKKSQFAL
jgi:hypothetical protein